MIRESWNRAWIFWKEGKKEKSRKIDLPHDAMIEETRSQDAPGGAASGFFYGGTYHYEKKFELTGEEYEKVKKGERWICEFEGVMRWAYIFLNGHFVGRNFSGTCGFSADLTSYLVKGKNVLHVKVKNNDQPNCRWYTGSGIYRPVWLRKEPESGLFMESQDIRIRTPEVSKEISEIAVQVPIVFREKEIKHVSLRTEIVGQSGESVSFEHTPVTLFPGENPTIRQRLFVRDAKLWSPETPALYQCRISLEEGEGDLSFDTYEAKKREREVGLSTFKKIVYDRAEITFGIRHFQADPLHGMRLNGEKILLRGACIHQDHGILGTADYVEAERYRIRKLKEAGFNAVRMAHHSASQRMLDICDQMGMLVLDETFDTWIKPKTENDDAAYFQESWYQIVESTVKKDFHHPCVFMYSIGNEIAELTEEEGIHISRQISDAFKRLDETRFVTNAVNSIPAVGNDGISMFLEMVDLTSEQKQALMSGDINDLMTALAGKLDRILQHPLVGKRLEEPLSHLDICGYNYMHQRYEQDLRQYPNRILMGSETNPPKIPELWETCLAHPALVGDFTWTGWDYLGEAGIGITQYDKNVAFTGSWPACTAYCGDLDITGYRMPVSYLREIVFGLRKKPFLCVEDPSHFSQEAKTTPWALPEAVESWTWPKYEGKPVRVRVFACGEEAVLFLNGKRIDTKKIRNYTAEFELIYEPGILEVSCRGNDGKEYKKSLKTAGPTRRLSVLPSAFCLGDSPENLIYIEIEVHDEEGILCMDREYEITVELSENIEILGFGSGRPVLTGKYQDLCQETYHGRLLAVVRGKPGAEKAGEIEASFICRDLNCTEIIRFERG